jgi:hypothetical protein
MTFDSLTFARRLRSAGFSDSQAEALAEANRDMLMPDLATKSDITAVKTDLVAVAQRLATLTEAGDQRLAASIEALGLRLTIRLGAMIAGAVAILGGILRLH